jgi:hypothetical protein
MVRRSARQQTQAHKSADKLEMMKDMKASRARQAGAEGDSDTDEVSERRAKETRRNIREMDVASSSDDDDDDDDDDDASELEEEGASESHDEAQSLVSDEEPEGGGEAPLEDVMAMQVCLFALLLRAPHAGTLLFVRALMAMPQRLRRRA